MKARSRNVGKVMEISHGSITTMTKNPEKTTTTTMRWWWCLLWLGEHGGSKVEDGNVGYEEEVVDGDNID
jgi:hypothetical protein